MSGVRLRVRAVRAALPLAAAVAGGCVAGARPHAPPLPPVVLDADEAHAERLAPGLVYRRFRISAAPWAIHVLEADAAYGWTFAAVKAGGAAVGRARTSALVAGLAGARARGEVGGGANADFFSYDPPGLPAGAHVEDGRVVVGPGPRPVVAVDSAGRPWIGRLAVRGRAAWQGGALTVAAWNRDAPGVAWFDANWGERTPDGEGRWELVLTGEVPGRYAVQRLDTASAGVRIPARGGVLVADRPAPDVRRAWLALRPGVDSVTVDVALEPVRPRDAVGGFPVLVRDSAVVPGLDAAGGPRFAPVRHPRTAVGFGHAGRRLLLVAVDGRQAPYSDGMTLEELAALLLRLGAAEALNLDGGGSTTLAVADPDAPGGVRIVNRPSDAAGERPVANAWVLVLAPRAARGAAFSGEERRP